MSDPELATFASLLGGAGLAIAGVARWAVALWATIRREEAFAAREDAKLKREADLRSVERQISSIDRIAALVDDHTAKDLAAQAEVRMAVVRVEAKLDAKINAQLDALETAWRERTPADETPSQRNRRRGG